ncbi:MAG: diguanylate cyclase [Azonexus sp.]|jgi:diguanylate cyclase (GGDEF)-like protein|nr:diguanylate cyclase [Azonexus sp.]
MHRDEVFKAQKAQKVLIIDASRVVRTSLAHCVRGNYSVCEAGNGETAWHSLVLDSKITTIISGLSLTNNDGAGLLEKIRSNRLSRIRNLPFYQLASDNLSEEERRHALQLGVTAFIPKTAPAATLGELLGEVGVEKSGSAETGHNSTIGFDDLGVRMKRMAGLGTDIAQSAGADETEPPAPELLPPDFLDEPLKQMSISTACVLIFGIDDYDMLCERFGRRIADKLVVKFSGLLHNKIRAKENLLLLADGRIGVALGRVDREQCATFARRVCKALASATISVAGQQIKVTVSAGVAAMPQDGGDLSPEALFTLASGRLDAAVAAGGNRVVQVNDGGENLQQKEFIARLASLLSSSPPDAEMPCRNWLRSICAACREARPEGELVPCANGGGDCQFPKP